MKVTAVANQKGGVGKTTTSVNLAAGLARAGKKTLLIDLDPQANATSALGMGGIEGESLYDALLGQGSIEEKVVPTRWPDLWIVTGDLNLAGAEIEVARMEDHLTRLRDALMMMREDATFDFVILDCPPSLGILMTNALAAADDVLVPIQCEYFALEGLSKIHNVVQQICESGANPGVHISGILMTMYMRNNLAQEVISEVQKHFAPVLYRTVVPRSVRLGEAPSHGLPIFEYEARGLGAAAYAAVTKEYIERSSK